jgi:MFS family permease
MSQIPDTQYDQSNYKWYVLTLAAMTHTIAVAVPIMAMPVLFAEISKDLRLNLIEIGWIWGIGSLTGIITSLIGGALGDRFGARRIIMAGCFLAGLTGALRGLSNSFTALTAMTFLFGLLPPVIPMNVHKTCGIWFSGKHLGMANGIVSAGMALGFMLGSLLSATVLSPLLGGWRQVFALYGALSVVLSIFWLFTKDAPTTTRSHIEKESVALSRGLAYVLSIRNVRLLGPAMLGIGGCIQGMLGYLPLYLRGKGWSGNRSDFALAMFHAISMLAAIPLALLSDRLGSRKNVLMAAGLMITAGVILLPLSAGDLVWLAVFIAGLVRDGFMAILMTLIIESKEIGTKHAATAMGVVLVFLRMGALISPPLGNSLAGVDPARPFFLWAAMAVLGVLFLCFVKDEKKGVLAFRGSGFQASRVDDTKNH